jgi:hypothetical protein
LIWRRFGVGNDLDEQHHDDAGPQCVTERIQQVGHPSERLLVADELSR